MRSSDHRGLIGLCIVAVFASLAAVSVVWTPHDIADFDVFARFQPPNATYWLGTDHFGRDSLSMLMVGARTSMLVAFCAVVIGACVGVPLGCIAAARGGWLDEAISRGNDLVFAFPALLSALILAAVMGPGILIAVVAIAIFNVPVFARVARGASLPVWRMEYATAARVAGKRTWRIIADHILPNIGGLLIVQLTIQLSVGVLQEAGLSYVGLGARPPSTSWGQMLAQAQTMAVIAPRLAIIPGLSIVAFVIGLNMIGNTLRERLDPRLGTAVEAR